MSKQEAELKSVEPTDMVPVETPDTEISKLISDESPEVTVARMEKVAELAPRYEAAIRQILLAATFPQDWERFGDGDKAKMCLGSAGAARVAKHFPVKYWDVQMKKEDFTDAIGRGYRYICTGKARVGEREVWAQGVFSTRDKFLGFANQEWRAMEDINENHIRSAAYHCFMGNAVKELLGLRAMPPKQFEYFMTRTGQDPASATGHGYGKGTKGGTTTDDKDKQRELAEACIAIANAGWYVEQQNGKWRLAQLPMNLEELPPMELAKDICICISGFKGKDGKEITGLPASKLKGKRLEITVGTARQLLEGIPDGND